MRRIIRGFVDQHIFVNVVVVLIIVAGLISIKRLNKEAFPDVDLDTVVIMTLYSGATSQEVEKFITKPIEDKLRGISNVKEVTSTSTEGRSIIVVELEEGLSDTEKSDVYDDIRSAVDLAKKDLPDDAEEPVIKIIKSSLLPVIQIGLYIDNNDYKELRYWADILEKMLMDVDGISEIEKRGYLDREFIVNVFPNKLNFFNVALTKLINVLKFHNVSLPAGTLEYGKEEFLVRTVGEFKSASDVANTVIRSSEDGYPIRIKDVANVRDGFEEAKIIEHTNGKRSIILRCIKKEKADIIKVVDRIDEVLKEFDKIKPKYIHYSKMRDMSFYVKRRLRVLNSNAIVGLVLVVFVLYFFLGFRIAFVTALGLPVAFFVTFSVMRLYDITINLMSLFGLIIVLGMLVDDAIIIAENIYRYIENGVKAKIAAFKGAYEVFYPVLSTVLTTIAAFLPLMLIGGMMGKFTWIISAVVIIALSASLLEAFFILPSHVLEVQRFGRLKKSLADKLGVMKFIKKVYIKWLKISLKFRYITVFVGVLLFVGSILLTKYGIDIVMFPSEGIEEFMIKMEAPVGTSLNETNRLVRQVEDLVARLPKNELDSYITRVGILQRSAFDKTTRVGSRFAIMIVYLTPPQNRKRTADEIVEDLRKKAKRVIKGFKKIEFVRRKPGPPVGMPIDIKVKGDDINTILLIAREYTKRLREIKGVKDVAIDYQQGKDEVLIKINDEKASLAGVTVQDIALAIRTAIDGTVATKIRTRKEEISIRVIFPKRFKKNLDYILGIKVQNRHGNLIPLKELVYKERSKSIFAIYHTNFKRSVSVLADVNEKITSVSKVMKRIIKEMTPVLRKHPGYTVEYGGEYKETVRSMRDFKDAFLVAAFLILLILATQFRSLVYPFIIMLAIPFGFIGVSLIFFLHGKPFSFMAFLGIVALSGVVVNDSIVLVSFILDLRRKGFSRLRSIVEAGRLRLRPVILTTVTTVFGLLPTAYGIGGFDPFVSPAALAMAWGLLFATGITLILMPSIVGIYDDIRRLFKSVD